MASKQEAWDREIATLPVKGIEYLCLTDIARYKNPEQADLIISSWLSNRNTVEILGLWEQLNNPDFKVAGFEGFKKQAGLNSFTLMPTQWIEATAATGLIVKPGRQSLTYDHQDIACEFACWLSVAFKFHFIRELQCPNQERSWQLVQDIKRNLAGIEGGRYPGTEQRSRKLL